MALLGPRPYRLAVAATEAIGDVQDVTEAFQRFCGRNASNASLYYWLEGLDVLTNGGRGSIKVSQADLDQASEQAP